MFCLWYVLSNEDKNILICANKLKTAVEILSRIQLAYQELPNWMKPGIVEWNKTTIAFDNGCKISAEATSANSGRGQSINVLICDEFAMLKPGIEEDFLQGVFPVVSSSKTSKIIVVSTPKGMGNEFYRIYTRASLCLEDNTTNESLKWTPVRIDWWDVPGRDEKWKQQQLETLGGDEKRFAQEYGNDFLGSTETLIDPEIITKLKTNFASTHKPYKEIQLHKEFKKTTIKIFYPPEQNHAYIIGADPSLGTSSDYHAMSVFDITNAYDIKQVATFYENEIPAKLFAYMLAKIATLYNNAFIAIENNGSSQVTLDALWRDYDYDNIINEGGNVKTSIGINSTNSRKVQACIFMKGIIEDPIRKFEINDGRLIAEMETFERRQTFGKMPTYAASDGHDDFMMSTIWALYSLNMEIIERYYDVRKIVLNKLGEQTPLFILPYKIQQTEDNDDYISRLDRSLNSFRENYMQQNKDTEDEVRNANIEEFIRNNKLNALDPNDENTQDQIDKLKEVNDDDAFGFSVF